jgi:hypothetical protein
MNNYKELRKHCKDMTMDELVSWIKDTPGHYKNLTSLWGYIHDQVDSIKDYRGAKHHRQIWSSIYEYLDIDFKDKTVMDLGPGSAESLIVAKDMGADKCLFVDNDPVIFRFCELLGFEGYYNDYRIDRPAIQKIDYLVAKGSINSDEWTNNKIDINIFLEWVESFAKNIIITPTFEKGETIDGWDYTCVGDRKVKYLTGSFHKTFINRGYKLIYVDGHNHEYRFPFTYVL